MYIHVVLISNMGKNELKNKHDCLLKTLTTSYSSPGHPKLLPSQLSTQEFATRSLDLARNFLTSPNDMPNPFPGRFIADFALASERRSAQRISCYLIFFFRIDNFRKLTIGSSLAAAPRATLTLLSCSPNFPSASISQNTKAKSMNQLFYNIAK